MALNDNAKIQIETGRTLTEYAVMTDSGDHTIFTLGTLWSGQSGYTPDVRPNGIVSGRNLITIHDDDDTINIGAFTAYSKGTLQSVSAATDSITRPSTSGRAQVFSVTMASDGSIAIVEGTISDDTTFSSTRGASGGPPLIPVNSVELGQIRTTASTAAAIAAAEIYQVVGTHTERADYPTHEVNNIGDGDQADTSAEKNCHVKFASANPLIHTGSVARYVYTQYYTPQFSDLGRAKDFSPAEETHSVSSEQVYGGTVGSSSKSLGAGGFSAVLADGVTGTLENLKDEICTVKFFPDENKSPYILTQGTIGLSRTFPADNHPQATVTIAAETKSANFTS